MAEIGVGLDQGSERDRVVAARRRELELAEDAKVIASKGAGADDCDAERSVHSYFLAAGLGASTASRQRP